MQNIRNFSIIAHIDHGKSTLADRLIERCGGLSNREMESQVLDSMDLERERGITIKAQTASLRYKAQDGQVYELNLIDTPGHVDFSYEVSRSLSACEGALLVVDATQGVEAQTVANCYTAIDLGVTVVPVLNKMDLPSAQPDAAREEIEDVIGIEADDAILCSAKTGMGVDDILEAVVKRIPPPTGDRAGKLKALVIDSWYDSYVGVVMLVRVKEGTLHVKDKIQLMATGATHLVEQLGVFSPRSTPREMLQAGEVGFIIAGIKEIRDARVGDTVTLAQNPATDPLPGFKQVKPQVFAGLYPVEASEYDSLRDALEKLQLNDASLRFEPEVSQALGFGFEVIEQLQELRRIRFLKGENGLLIFVLVEHVTVGQRALTVAFAPAGVDEIEHVVAVLQIHAEALQTVRDFAGDRLAGKTAHLLEIRELGHFHAVHPDFPAETPGAKRRIFPVILNEADIMQ